MQRLDPRGIQPGDVDELVLVTRGDRARWLPLGDLSPEAGGPLAFNDLSDVDTATVPPTDGQAPLWDDATGQWRPGSIAAGITSHLVPLTVVVDGEPGFLWTSDDQLMMAEVSV